MTAKLAPYCRGILQTLALFGHDMRRTEYGIQDGTEYAHFTCDNCGAKIGFARSPAGRNSRSCEAPIMEKCRK
jgi:hypothetical protein